MKLVYRRIFFWLSVITFFILGPSLIFYAQGYRIIPKDRTIVTTGTIVVSSRPVNANIKLDNELLDISTPYTIDSLVPGEHLIELMHKDYLPWSKRLVVKENQSTFASDVRLIKKTEPRQMESVDYIFYEPSSRRGFLTLKQSTDGLQATFRRSQVFSNLVQSNREVLIPTSSSSRINVVAWQTSDDRLVLKIDDRFWLVDFTITDQPVKELTALIPDNYKAMRWSTRNTDELLVVNSNAVNLINLATVTKREIPNTSLSGEVFVDAFTSGNTVLVILSTNESARVVSLNLQGVVSEIAVLDGSRHNFIGQDNDTLVLKTGDGQLQVYHINGDDFRAGYSFGYVNEALYNSDSHELLFTTGSELYTYDIRQDHLNLLVRQTKPISHMDWFEDSHITYLSENTIHLIERDGRNGHINWRIVDNLATNGYFVNNSFNKVYYVSRIDGVKYLFEREI